MEQYEGKLTDIVFKLHQPKRKMRQDYYKKI
jgi:hypothetical protein